MTFVTKLTFQSGDRAVLEETVSSLKGLVEKKGGQCKGPHASQPEQLNVPLYRTLQPGDEFPAWSYTVYERRIDIYGADHIARKIGHMEFPDSVHLEIEVEQHKPLGQGQK